MNYEEEIIIKLTDDLNWPEITKPDLMAKLDGFAEEAFINPSEQHYIAAILIYQQLTEELLKILFDLSSFLMRAQLLPLQKEVVRIKNKMFGQVINEFTKTIDFPMKKEMIDIANKINKKRIKVAHGLIKEPSIATLKSDTHEVSELFFKLFDHYDEAQEWLRQRLRNIYDEKVEQQPV